MPWIIDPQTINADNLPVIWSPNYRNDLNHLSWQLF